MKHYIICSQPRSGTHYLSALLEQHKCGNAQELFYHLIVNERIPTLDVFYKYFKECILNGIFGIVCHRLHYKGGMERLRELSGMMKETDFDVLRTFFPDVKFIYFYRQNKVKQAISFLKAKRSGHYLFMDNPEFGEYSEDEISKFIRHLCVSEAQWFHFFQQYGIHPHVLTYESLCSDTTRCIQNILDFLKVDPPEIKIDADSLPKRQYDKISEEWYQRYISEGNKLDIRN